jgi:hypothetical protein
MTARRQFRLTPPQVPEHAMQRIMAKMFALEIAPAGRVSEAGVCWFSIDMSNYAGEVPGIRIGRGIVAGVPDVLILFHGCSYWIELKTDTGILDDPQRSMAATLLLSGCRIGVARDEREAIALLDTWEIPRKHRIRLAA